jgi:hypothetical protein
MCIVATTTTTTIGDVTPLHSVLLNATALLVVGRCAMKEECLLSLWSTEHARLLGTWRVKGALKTNRPTPTTNN